MQQTQEQFVVHALPSHRDVVNVENAGAFFHLPPASMQSSSTRDWDSQANWLQNGAQGAPYQKAVGYLPVVMPGSPKNTFLRYNCPPFITYSNKQTCPAKTTIYQLFKDLSWPCKITGLPKAVSYCSHWTRKSVPGLSIPPLFYVR
jgi:hypothetical protein